MFKAKCKQNLYPYWSKSKKSFIKDKIYNFSQELHNDSYIFVCNDNELGNESVFNLITFAMNFDLENK